MLNDFGIYRFSKDQIVDLNPLIYKTFFPLVAIQLII